MSYSNLNISIVCTIAAVCAKYHNKYCFITQERFLQLLKEFYDITISRRTLNYHLKELEENNYIKRFRRVVRNKDGTLRTLPTMYTLGQKAYFLFKRVTAIFDRFIRRTDVQSIAHNNSLRSVLDNNKNKKTHLGKREVNKKTSLDSTIRQSNPPPAKEKKKEEEEFFKQKKEKIQTQQTTQRKSDDFKSTPEYWQELQKRVEQLREQRKKEQSSFFTFFKKRELSEAEKEERKRRLKQYWENVYKDEIEELRKEIGDEDLSERIRRKAREILEKLEQKRKRKH